MQGTIQEIFKKNIDDSFSGKTPKDFTHIVKDSNGPFSEYSFSSYYNHNYWIDDKGNVLYQESDDDNFSDWFYCFLSDANNIIYKMYIGYSFTKDDDKIFISF